MRSRRLVLFVCEHGAAKSVVAAAHFNQMARRRGVNAFAASRGVVPDPELHPAARAGLEAEALSGDVTPTALLEDNVRMATRIVTFGVTLPIAAPAATRVEDWSDVPAVSAGYDAARDAIVARVSALIDDMLAAG
jgi:protein-tyrosine-phosphatase